MTLSIYKYEEVFYLYGNLNKLTSKSFIIYFKHVLRNSECMEINIDGVNDIDINGIKALGILNTIALNTFKNFTVRSYLNNELFNTISYINAA